MRDKRHVYDCSFSGLFPERWVTPLNLADVWAANALGAMDEARVEREPKVRAFVHSCTAHWHNVIF